MPRRSTRFCRIRRPRTPPDVFFERISKGRGERPFSFQPASPPIFVLMQFPRENAMRFSRENRQTLFLELP
ncbi:hypothetical protein FJ976_07445 [Mesorhizobium sp. B1-1-9]|nr:hypothetical protein FJ978_06430 [Mesorhizobium sp. B1-1-7]TPN55405.1 hypothetical protein FJ976_07445 [Mesorhizobium sp. B1-1-9]